MPEMTKPMKRIAGALAFLALLSCSGTLWLVFRKVDFLQASASLESAAAEYRKNGFPYEARDLYSGEIKPQDNAAVEINQLKQSFPKKAKSTNLDQLAINGEWEKLRSELAPYRMGLALAREASKRPALRMGWDRDLGANTHLPELAEVKSAARVLSLSAELEAHDGYLDSAMEDWGSAWQLGKLLEQEPLVITVLVRIAVEGIVLISMNRAVDRRHDDMTWLNAFEKGLGSLKDPIPDFGNALRGEAYMGLATMRNLDRIPKTEDGSEPKIDPSILQRTGLPEGTMKRAFAARGFQAWNELYRNTNGLKASPIQIGRETKRIAARLEDVSGLSDFMAMLMFPAFGDAGLACLDGEARLNSLNGLVYALKVRAQTGAYPSSVPFVDPYINKPLKLKVMGHSIRVYSVGRDLKDNGGLAQSERKPNSKDGFDTVAAYPPVARKVSR